MTVNSFNATTAPGRAIQVKFNVYSANLALIRKSGFMKTSLIEPTSYVQIKVDQNHWNSTAKSRAPTTNPTWEENIMVTVKPGSKVRTRVLSFHKSTPDKVIADGFIDIARIVHDFPPSVQTATIQVDLQEPALDGSMEKEEIESKSKYRDMKLQVQIKEWPAFVNAVNRLQEHPTGVVNTPHPLGDPIDNQHMTRNQSSIPHSSTTSTNTSDSSPLPAHYEERQDPHTGRNYYVDHLTRTTHWVRPQPLPSNWERRLDPQQQRVYYVDHVSRRTQWKHPNENQPVEEALERRNRYDQRFIPGQSDITNSRGDSSSRSSRNLLSSPEQAGSLLADMKMADRNSRNSSPFGSRNNLDKKEDEPEEEIDASDIEAKFGAISHPWEEKKQAGSGRKYYVNHVTKTSQWDDPRTFGLSLEMRAPTTSQ